MANEAMREFWNGDQSSAWVTSASRFDAMLAPYIPILLDSAGLDDGEAVVDVGCGSGALARAAAAVVGPGGSVTGLDISAPLISLARESSAGIDHLSFMEGDAQTTNLGDMAADVVISRFGVMFFDDPIAAFANLGRAAAPGGRLAFGCWRSALENEWITVPMGAIVPILGMPDLPAPDAPGPFRFADADGVRSILGQAGWNRVEVAPLDVDTPLGGTADFDTAVDFILNDAMARRLLEGKTEDQRAEAEAALREALAPHRGDEGVILAGAAWLVTASR